QPAAGKPRAQIVLDRCKDEMAVMPNSEQHQFHLCRAPASIQCTRIFRTWAGLIPPGLSSPRYKTRAFGPVEFPLVTPVLAPALDASHQPPPPLPTAESSHR